MLISQVSYYYTLCLFHYLEDIRIIPGLMGAFALTILWYIPWFGNFCTVNVGDKVPLSRMLHDILDDDHIQ